MSTQGRVRVKVKAVLLASALSCAFPAWSAPLTVEQKLDLLQQEIEALKAQLAKRDAQPAPATGTTSASTTTNAAPGALFSGNRTTLGGYGEVVYNNYRDSSKKDQADLRRFVLFFGHKFTDRLRLQSELEFEHGYIDEGKPGEVALEQAFVEYGLTDRMNLRAGLSLIPLGILNETHEPTTFYGVERNEVETRIIPSTWRELGVSLQGEAMPGLEYNVGVSTAPDAGRFENASSGIRSMRTSGGKAPANGGALFGALNYRGVPGLLVGGGVFSGNTAQSGTTNAALKGADARLTLWDVHARYAVNNLDLQALYARGRLNDTAKINAAAGLAAGSNEAAPEAFYGWYTQAAYHVWKKGDMDLAPFVRYERYNTQEKVAPGFSIDPLNSERVWTVGANFWLAPGVVFKADYQNYQKDNAKDRFNLGVGYQF